MSREPSYPGEDERPLARSSFFRSIEEGEASETGDWSDADDPTEDADAWAEGEFDDGLDQDAGSDEDGGRRGGRRERSEDRAASGSSMLVTLFGWMLAVSGTALGVLSFQASGAGVARFLDGVERFGVAPGTLIVTGIVLVVLGSLRGQTERRARHDELRFSRIERALERAGDRPLPQGVIDGGSDGVQLEHALLALERQDEKLANLTRATKMYGKPLIDISKQVAELADQLADMGQTATALEGLTARLDQMDGRITELATADRGGVDPEQFGEVQAALRRSSGAIDQLRKSIEERLDDTRKHVGDLAETARRVDERTRDLESRVVARVDEAWQDGRRRSDELITTVRQGRDAASGIGEQIESERRALTESVEALRQSLQNVGGGQDAEALHGIESALAAIRREVGGVATQVARIDTRPATGAPAAASAPAPAPAPTPSPQSGPTPTLGGGEGVAHKIAGARQAGGQNVLGAIAKLRSMKGP